MPAPFLRRTHLVAYSTPMVGAVFLMVFLVYLTKILKISKIKKKNRRRKLVLPTLGSPTKMTENQIICGIKVQEIYFYIKNHSLPFS